MPSAPSTYRAAQISTKGGQFELIDVDYKQPGEGQVVVKTLACGVCHSSVQSCTSTLAALIG